MLPKSLALVEELEIVAVFIDPVCPFREYLDDFLLILQV